MIIQFQNFIQILANKNGTLKTLKNKENYYDNLKRKKPSALGKKSFHHLLFCFHHDQYMIVFLQR